MTFEKRSSYSSLTTNSDKLNPDGTAPHFFACNVLILLVSTLQVCRRYITVWPGVGGVQVEVDDADGALCAGGELSHPPHLQAERPG